MTGVGSTNFEIGKNIAYPKTQQKQLIDYAAAYPAIQFAMRFLYYTTCRSSELARIQVKDIFAKHPDKLYMPAEKTKVNRERHPMLHPKLKEYITANKILKLDPEMYLFGLHFKPNVKQWYAGDVGKYYRRMILKPLHYNTLYTFSSWKHTGVVTMHKNGVPDFKIMQQAGWSTYKAFQVYLKSLGLEENIEVVTLIDEF